MRSNEFEAGVPPRGRRGQRGFALVVLLIVVAAAGAAVAGYIASRSRPDVPGKLRKATYAVGLVAGAAEEAYLSIGAFPANLAAALGTVSRSLALSGIDPYTGNPLDYQIQGSNPSSVLVRSVGPDRILGTADDIQKQVSEEVVGRARTHPRLRTLRAVYFASPLCAGTMTLANRTALLTSKRRYTIAQKELLYLNDAAHRGVRDLAATTLSTTLSTILSLLGITPVAPVSATGPGGLLALLGLPDSLGVDGFGNTFYVSTTVGFMSAGGDRTAGTDDDF